MGIKGQNFAGLHSAAHPQAQSPWQTHLREAIAQQDHDVFDAISSSQPSAARLEGLGLWYCLRLNLRAHGVSVVLYLPRLR